MPLEPIEIRDCDDAAFSNRRALDVDRHIAADLGAETLRAIREGSYLLPDGRRVDWSESVATAIAAKVTIPPDATLPGGTGGFASTSLTIANETTLRAAKQMVGDGEKPLVLNMANGVSRWRVPHRRPGARGGALQFQRAARHPRWGSHVFSSPKPLRLRVKRLDHPLLEYPTFELMPALPWINSGSATSSPPPRRSHPESANPDRLNS